MSKFHRETFTNEELVALQYMEQLFASMPCAKPHPNFVAMFEVRLAQRIKQRQTNKGVIVISMIVVLAAGLLAWAVAEPSLQLLAWLNQQSIVIDFITIIENTLATVPILFKSILLLAESMMILIQYPIAWAYIAVTIGLVALWTQTLKWMSTSTTGNNVSFT
ncbi:MAG: hypothetical protein B6242_06100 [Anaerolineaceae bacterium 4572_78]|nr:MAG: hypothetical protein B6242_06100 [Anaerolineaceae bacterium 4572_78]